jgi:hypothetical protein
MNRTGNADTDGAHGLLQYSGESETLFVLDKVFYEKTEEVA